MLIEQLKNSPYPQDKIYQPSLSYLYDKYNHLVENWEVIASIIDQFVDDHNAYTSPAHAVLADYNLYNYHIDQAIEGCYKLLEGDFSNWQHYLEYFEENTREDTHKIIEFLKWLKTIPQKYRVIYHAVHDHETDKYLIDQNKVKALLRRIQNEVSEAC